MGGRADSDGIGDSANRCLRSAVRETRRWLPLQNRHPRLRSEVTGAVSAVANSPARVNPSARMTIEQAKRWWEHVSNEACEVGDRVHLRNDYYDC
jgi:hypothetical protein